jgi:glycosyltransferase involved in cell wall biosynthesis
MNQEYVLLGGFIWKILKKKVYFWRNHKYGNLLTKIAVWFSNKVFCTSKFSFVAKYKKTKMMPAGINLQLFKISNPKSQIPNSILFLGRMSPIKKPDLLIEALNILNKKNVDFVCDLYGDSLPKDEYFYDSLKNKAKEFGLESKINFYKSVPNYKTPKIYNEHNIFVNLTPSGSFDKTILEAAACGCIIVVTNRSLAGEIDNKMIAEETADDVAEKIEFWLNVRKEEKKEMGNKLSEFVYKKHSLNALSEALQFELKNKHV